MKAKMHEQVELPAGVTASYEEQYLTVKGEKGEIRRKLYHPYIDISVKDNTVHFNVEVATQREKRFIFTFRAHTRNMVRGCQEPHVYKLKICSGHFPMNVSLTKEALTIKNFLGEAVPRVLKLKQGATVKMDGDIITVTAPDKELAGQQAADIEQLTRITNRDRRIFQDGVYIIEKDGKAIEQ